MAKNVKKRTPSQFFYAEAGLSYDPKKETKEQGRKRGARELAKAEAWLAAQPGHQILWEEDDYPDRSGVDHDGMLYGVVVTLSDGRCASLYGVDLGAAEDISDPYTRVVVAELALELMGGR